MLLDTAPDKSSVELRYHLKSQQMTIGKLSQDLVTLQIQMDELSKANSSLLQLLDTPHPSQIDAQQYFQQKAELILNNDYGLVKDLFMALAHEVNQPLAILSTYSSSCLMLLKDARNDKNLSEKLIPILEFITSQAEFAGKIVHNMKSFVNIDELVIEEADVNELIKESLMMLNYELMSGNFKIILNLADDLPLLTSNRINIIQVVINLIRNSMQALSSSSETNPEIEVTTYQQGNEVIVHVTDNGPGISPKFQSKIFDIHFTTKREGSGIGLGICRVLIEMLDGEIQVCNHKDKGACLMFKLPIRV